MARTKVRPGLLWRRHIKKLAPLEASFADKYRGLMRELRAAARETENPFSLKKWQDRVAEGMRPEYVKAILAGGRDFLGNTLAVRKAVLGGWVTKARKRRAADVVLTIESAFEDRIRETVQTTWDALADVIEEAQEDDLDADEIEDLLDEEWDDVLGSRAEEIAGTEVNGAVNSVRDYLMRQLVELQDWVNSEDERVRLTHRIYGEAGPKPVGFDYSQLADDAGYSIRYPCDPECHEAAEIVGCRCFMVPAGELEFDEEELAEYLEDFEMDPEDLMSADDQEAVYVQNPYSGKAFDPDQPRDDFGRWVDIFGNTVEERAPDTAQTDDPRGPNYAWADSDEPGSAPPRSQRMLDEVYEKKAATVEARTAELRADGQAAIEARRATIQRDAEAVKRMMETEKPAVDAAMLRAANSNTAFNAAVANELAQDKIEYAQARARLDVLGVPAGITPGGEAKVGTQNENSVEINAIGDRLRSLDEKWGGDIDSVEPMHALEKARWLLRSDAGSGLMGAESLARGAENPDNPAILMSAKAGSFGPADMMLTSPEVKAALGELYRAEGSYRLLQSGQDSLQSKLSFLSSNQAQLNTEEHKVASDAANKAIAEQGVDFSYERAMRDDSVHRENMETIGRSWAHIGGEGPITLRYAAEIGLGLEKGAAFDSKLGRFVTDLEADYPGATANATALAGSIRREYEESQEELADGIEFTLHGGDDDEIDYDALHEMQSEAFDNLSASDKVEYIEGDKKLHEKAINWGLDNEEEVVKYAENNSSDARPEPAQYVDAKTAREIVPEGAKAIVDTVNRYKNGRDDDGEDSDLETSYHKLDMDVDASRALDRRFRDTRDTRPEPTAEEMRSALGRAQRMSDAALSPEDSPFLADIAAAAEFVEAGKLEDARPLIDRINSDFRQWGESTLKEFKSDVIPEIDASSLQTANESAYEAFDEAHREWLDPYHLEAYAAADPDGEIMQKFAEGFEPDEYPKIEGSGSEDITINADDWPLKLHRTVSADVNNYTPNYMESWAYDKQHFGSQHMEESIDPARILVFQGAKNWQTPKGQESMGNRENEFIVLSDVPKFVKESRARYEKVKAGQVKLRESDGKRAQRDALVQRFRDLRRMQNYGGREAFDNLRDQIEAQASAMGLEWEDLVGLAREDS